MMDYHDLVALAARFRNGPALVYVSAPEAATVADLLDRAASRALAKAARLLSEASQRDLRRP